MPRDLRRGERAAARDPRAGPRSGCPVRASGCRGRWSCRLRAGEFELVARLFFLFVVVRYKVALVTELVELRFYFIQLLARRLGGVFVLVLLLALERLLELAPDH